MPQAKLRELVATLLQYRNELELALKGSNTTLVTSAQRLVHTEELIIRHHCERWGLPRPANVPTAVPPASEKDART